MKNVAIKVYLPDGTFIKILENVKFEGFTKEINAGLGSCILEIGEAFDYTGREISLGNIVEVLISDKDTVSLDDGYVLVYTGYISKYSPYISGGKEGIRVELLGHYTKLSLDILKNGTQTSLYTKTTDGLTTTLADISSAEIVDVIKAIIARYIAETGGKMLYSGNTITANAGVSVEYTFESKTYRESLDKLLSMTPANWYWYFDENFNFYFREKATTPKHTFIVGKHFENLTVEQDMEKVRNLFLLWNGEDGTSKIYKLYTGTSSIGIYGRRLESFYDYSIGDETTADAIGNKFINEAGEQEIKVICDIIDNNESDNRGYDIESIQPGDTCRFVGFNEAFADIFRDNMMISKVVYSLNKVELTIEISKGGLTEWQSQTSKKVDDLTFVNMPETYTT
jgi:hypothetical protein